MKDNYGRTIDYMRISITDRCNLRCKYCMPMEGIECLPMSEILSYEEIELICRAAVKLGITKFKITGGEPLVRKGCVEFVKRLKQISGVKQVTMTTNGVALLTYLPGLLDAGLDAVNISLDTLNREYYQSLTGFDQLENVKQSICQAMDSGIKVKINSVLLDGGNKEEWMNLAVLAQKYPLDVRFIELMPIGYGKQKKSVSNEWLLKQLILEWPDLSKDHEVHGNGPAVYYRSDALKGSIGLISAIHGKFCSNCNRIRLTSTGFLKPCLCFGQVISLREAVKKQDIEQITALIEKTILEKPKMHCFDAADEITETHRMAQIGG